jgi:hypothetical protein
LLHHACRIPAAGWLWCALALVSACDTNVLARVLTGQVAAAPGQRSEGTEEDDEGDYDGDDACETPFLPPAPSLGRRHSATDALPAQVPAEPGAPAGSGSRGPGAPLGLLAPPIPLHGGVGLPLRC